MAAHQTTPPAASATAIFIYGNQTDERRRISFCNHLISFADLDNYPRRAEFIATFSPGGTEQARRIEAKFLADYNALTAADVAHCVAQSVADPFFNGEIQA